MLFIRNAARNIFIRSGQIDLLAEYLVSNYNAEIKTFDEGWEEVEEFQTLLFLTRQGLTKTIIDDAEKVVIVPFESSMILSELYKPQARELIDTVHLASGIIIVRVAGDGTALEEILMEKYSAESMELEQAVSAGEADDTILILTNTSLSKKISRKDLIRRPLLIRQQSHSLYREMRKQGARLITQSLKDRQWYEMRINIYDSANHYDIHYERLQTVFSDLDIGMILGETWTRDHALVLMSVLAYQVRLFSLEPPSEIKRVLMGLEFTEKGDRFADMDLYYRNRKVSKNDNNIRKHKNETMVEIREDLLKRLTPPAVNHLQQLEASIEKDLASGN